MKFSGLEQPSKSVLGSMVALNKNFGIGITEGAQLNKVFQNIGGFICRTITSSYWSNCTNG